MVLGDGQSKELYEANVGIHVTPKGREGTLQLRENTELLAKHTLGLTGILLVSTAELNAGQLADGRSLQKLQETLLERFNAAFGKNVVDSVQIIRVSLKPPGSRTASNFLMN